MNGDVPNRTPDDVTASEPPPEWRELWHAARQMLQTYGEHRHEGRCERCNASWDRLHAALLAASSSKVTS